MQQKETAKSHDSTDISSVPKSGRLVAIDPGTKRIGVAVCDEMRVIARPLPVLQRTSWKKLLEKIKDVLAEFDATALIVGLPYNFDGTESEMSLEARDMARKLALSLGVPVFLQDERATTYEARGRLWNCGRGEKDVRALVDSEAATVILTDFLTRIK